MPAPTAPTRGRAQIETWLEQQGAPLGAVLQLIAAEGRRWSHVAGNTRKAPDVPARRIPVDDRVALMVYREAPIRDEDAVRLAEQARHDGLARTALELTGTEDPLRPEALTPETLDRWLREDHPDHLETLWRTADQARKSHVGDAVHLRGLIEISSYCVRHCAYCGLHAGRRGIPRYRMSDAEILACVDKAVAFGYGTVVLQSGEDPGLDEARMAHLVARIKQETPLAVTLSLGERAVRSLRRWRKAGADRYLLRFETADPALYARIHPPRRGQTLDRFDLLRILRDLGYEIGSGVMVGIPGQTYRSLARDLTCFRELDLDMVGVGPFIPHPETPLGNAEPAVELPDQTPADEITVYKVMALTRILCPDANIPSTTALATLNRAQGRERGLMRGANVVMPNLTPTRYRRAYEIYPAKVCIDEAAEDCRNCMRGRILSTGREIGHGPGGRRRA